MSRSLVCNLGHQAHYDELVIEFRSDRFTELQTECLMELLDCVRGFSDCVSLDDVSSYSS